MSNARWIGRLPDKSKRLCEITIPGSHDAGVYRDTSNQGPNSYGYAKDHGLSTNITSTSRFTNAGNTACQSESIMNQAVAGSRFFDCRVFLRSFPLKKYENGHLKKKQQVPYMGHFAQDKNAGLGGYGGSLMTVINDALSFVKQHPSEFIILRFTHTKCTEEVANALEYVYDQGNNANFIFADAHANIAQTRICDLQGKLVMVFDSKFNKQRLTSMQSWTSKRKLRSDKVHYGQRGLSSKGMNLFTKYSAGKAVAHGLACCGKYSMDLGKSFGKKMDIRWDQQLEAAKEHQSHTLDHLCFMYWQVTGGNIEENTTKDGGPHARLHEFVRQLVSQGPGRVPNIISHDFVSQQTCSEIISLNFERKKFMAEAAAEAINAMR